ncbi:hypothetical protein ENBRE01_1080 [Enteropsectra breve]|nr:hypothetical protein ENBRE01_1080 [Enteropsectra breve]
MFGGLSNALLAYTALVHHARAAEAPPAELEEVYVGIDLGTTFSCVSLFKPKTKTYEFLPYGAGLEEIFPSTVYVDEAKIENGKQLLTTAVGYLADAKNKANPDSNNYFYAWKRIIGVSDYKKVHELKDFDKHVTYKVDVQSDKEGKKYTAIHGKSNGVSFDLTPTILSKFVLRSIFEDLKQKNYSILSTAVSTPANFTVIQDNETRYAATEAGFVNPLIVKEPVSACVVYSKEANLSLDDEKRVLIFDFGGGTLDISVVEVEKEQSDENKDLFHNNLRVIKTVGDNFLGGENVNHELVKYFISELRKKGLSVAEQSNQMLVLRNFAEAFKIALCNKVNEVENNEVDKVSHCEKWIHDEKNTIEFTLNKAEFDRIVKPVYDRINAFFWDNKFGLFRKNEGDVHDKPVDPLSIENVILVGGSTRIPYIRKMLGTICKKAQLYYNLDADKAVAKGACYICVANDPSQKHESIMVLDAVPLPIGIEVVNGIFEPILRKDVTIPTTASKLFTTNVNNQEHIRLHVASGVRPRFADNDIIGSFDMQIKGGRKAGVPKIEVSILFAADFSFEVVAKDLDTNESASARFDSKYGRPEQSVIDKMMKSGEENEEADKLFKERVDAFATFDGTLRGIESMMETAKLSEDDKVLFETTIEEKKKWAVAERETASVAVIKSQIDALKELSEDLMKKGAAPSAEESPKEDMQNTNENNTNEQIQEEAAKETGREAL